MSKVEVSIGESGKLSSVRVRPLDNHAAVSVHVRLDYQDDPRRSELEKSAKQIAIHALDDARKAIEADL